MVTHAIRCLVYDRDLRTCVLCGLRSGQVALTIHHRANRGMGGGGLRHDRPSNLLTVCAVDNELMESDPHMADLARRNGWKISRYANPLRIPVTYPDQQQWLLDDHGDRRQAGRLP